MSRTKTTFGLLQAVALVLALATITWSLGLTSFRFAEAANVTSFSDTLSDSAPSVAANHTITFVTPTGITDGEDIVLDFSDGPFDLTSIGFEDIDVLDDATDLSVAADCTASEEVGAEVTGSVLTLTFCAGDTAGIGAFGTTTIKIGDHTTVGAVGTNQIINPAAGSYEISVTAGASDSGDTRVAIVSPVVVTASVDTSFTFTVAGVAGGGTVNGEVVTGSSTATTIPFGVLAADTASTAAQQLSVATNASYGFAVTVQVDQQLLSSTGADIDGFIDGAYTTTPVAWEAPAATISDEDTWGHWGLTTDDATLTAGLSDPFDVGGVGQRFVSASSTPVEVFRHDGPSDGTTQGIGRAQVGYKVEISPLQEAGDDYTATLTYVATPVF